MLNNPGVVRRMAWDPGQTSREVLLNREWIVTNGLGGYASGTVSGAVTRRYHGLLIAALAAPLGRVVMWNHLSESLRFNNDDVISLGGEERGGGQLNLKGADYLRISTRRWVADLDLSCARLGFRKAGNSSALTKHSACDLPHSERRQSSATRVAPGVSFSSSRDSGEQRHCRALQAHRGERPLRDRAGPARISRLANEIVQLRIGFHHCGQEDSASCLSHQTKPRLCPQR